MLGIYFMVGAFAGIASGLFGIGGGIIVVPALVAIFATSTLIPPTDAMQTAIGTSLAIMIFTTLAGAYAHLRRGAVRWHFVKQLVPYLLLGVLMGVMTVQFLPSHLMKIIFSVFLVFMAIHLLRPRSHSTTVKPIPSKIRAGIATLIGALTSVLGAGGGAMLVPFLMRLQLNMREALGTSLACCIFISLMATLCFSLTGYIYWPAFLGIAVASVVFAPLGALLAHKLPIPILKRLFALFMILMALDMVKTC